MINIFAKREKLNKVIKAVVTKQTSNKNDNILVMQIHKEIDDAEEKILSEVKIMLAGCNIKEEQKLKDKASLAAQLGFLRCSPVTEYDKLKAENNSVLVKKETAENLLQLINKYKLRYPLEKFIPVTEFEKILLKYSLVYAGASYYIKDIPEKNLLEIRDVKKLEYHDVCSLQYRYEFNYCSYVPNNVRNWLNNAVFDIQPRESDSGFRELCPIKYQGPYLYNADGITQIRTSKQGFFIAAPPSHFDLKDLEQMKDNKFGYFNVEKTIINRDPIVFEFLKGNIIRIITKWGTSDDQSYLDPIVQNETLN